MATKPNSTHAPKCDWRTLAIVALPLWITLAVLIDSALAGGLAQ